MKKIIGLFLTVILLSSVTGCGGNITYTGEPKASSSKVEVTSSENVVEDTTTYQSVLDEYTEKLKVATPTLIDEYNAEAAANTEGLNGLAKISNDKIGKLAEISTEGIGEMASIHLKTGSGKNSEYEEWAGKLQDVYMTESTKITQAYMDSTK